jgi:HEAT repeat protein
MKITVRIIFIIGALAIVFLPIIGCTPNVEELKENGDIKSLIDVLNYQKDPSVRINAADALGEIGDNQVVAPLIDALDDDNQEVRKTVIQSLGEIGDERAISPLIKTLDDDFWEVRLLAAEALGKIGKNEAVLPLVNILNNESFPAVRKAAVVALGSIGGDQVVFPLIKALKDVVTNVNMEAHHQLVIIGSNGAVEPLIDALENGYIPAAYVLGDIGDKRAIEPLINALESDYSPDRIPVSSALIDIVGDDIDQLLPYLTDKDTVTVYFVLIRMGDSEAEDELAQALWRFGTKEIAEDYLNCGNSSLEAEAIDWANNHGYTVSETEFGASGSIWGSK